MAQEFASQNEFAVSRATFAAQPQSAGFGSGIRYRGAWDPYGTSDPLGTSYGVNDVVTYNNRSYLCLAANTSTSGAGPAVLPTNTQYWRLVPPDSVVMQMTGPDDFGPLPVLGDDFASPQVLERVPQVPPGFSSLYTRDF